MPADHPDFAAASPSLRALAARGVERTFARRTQLIAEGDLGQTMYIILDGRVRIYSANEDGRQVTFGEYGPGDYVGELSLDGNPRSASVETLERTQVAIVTRQTLLAHLAEDPQFAFELMSRLIFRLRLLTERARDLALSNVYGRLRNLLNRLAAAQPDGTRVTAEPMTHKQIAQHIGCVPSMVTKLLRGLERHGCLVQEPDHRYRITRPLPPKW